MKIIKIEPKDIYVTFEIGLENLKKLAIALSLSEIKYQGTEEKDKEAVIYLTNTFFPTISKVLEDLEGPNYEP